MHFTTVQQAIENYNIFIFANRNLNAISSHRSSARTVIDLQYPLNLRLQNKYINLKAGMEVETERRQFLFMIVANF